MTGAYQQPDLAWMHHSGYSQHVAATSPGILQLLREAGLGAGAGVLAVGRGSGLLARELLAAGYAVRGARCREDVADRFAAVLGSAAVAQAVSHYYTGSSTDSLADVGSLSSSLGELGTTASAAASPPGSDSGSGGGGSSGGGGGGGGGERVVSACVGVRSNRAAEA
jgi:Zn-dependent protease with chaperone function